MSILKAMIAVGSQLHKIDAIEHDGKLWIVPYWFDIPERGVTKPGRIIRVDTLRTQDVRGGQFGDVVVHDPLPKEILEMNCPEQMLKQFEYVDHPNIEFPIDARPRLN
jgi:hypothetical protein